MIPVINGDRVTLRGFTWADFPAFADMWQEPEVAEYIPFAPVPASQSWSRFNGNCYRWTQSGFGNWAVVNKQGAFLGTTGFFRRDVKDTGSDLESGWVFNAAAQGRGYGSEALALSHVWLDRQVFGGKNMCMMDPKHTASIRVAQKVGYQLIEVTDDPFGPVQIMQRNRPI